MRPNWFRSLFLAPGVEVELAGRTGWISAVDRERWQVSVLTDAGCRREVWSIDNLRLVL